MSKWQLTPTTCAPDHDDDQNDSDDADDDDDEHNDDDDDDDLNDDLNDDGDDDKTAKRILNGEHGTESAHYWVCQVAGSAHGTPHSPTLATKPP